MFKVAVFITMELADLVTMLLLPVGSEINPIAPYPIIGATGKILLIVFILYLPLGRYRDNVILIGTTIAAIGLGANLSVIA